MSLVETETAASMEFLSGGGEMGDRIRSFDWAVTPLGPPQTWPQSLRSAVSICLHSSFPTAIYWGDELRLLYNDAWAPIPAERHPGALGQPGAKVWQDIWPIVGPQFDSVMVSGEGFSTYDHLLPMVRHGVVRETYWNYSFTPIRGEDGRVVGVFNQGHETTDRVLFERRKVAETDRLRRMFDQAPGFMALLSGPNHIFELTNAAYVQLIGHRDVIGMPATDALPEVRGQGFIDLLDNVYRTGEPFVGRAVPVELQSAPDAMAETRYLDFIYQPVTDADGQVTGIFVQGSDVTDRFVAESALRDSEARFGAIANSVDQMIWSTRADGFHDYYNDRWYEFTGVPHGSTDGEAWNGMFHPEDQDRAWSVWRHSLATGEPYHIEYRLRHRSGAYRWVLGRAQCVRDSGGNIVRWFGTCTDIQDIVEAREILASSREKLEAEVADRTRERNRVWEMSNDLFAVMGFDGRLKAINPAWEDVLGRDESTLLSLDFSQQVHPDDHDSVREMMAELKEGRSISRFEDRLRHADGSWRSIAWSLVPEGDVFYAVGRDVTAERQAAAELESAQDALRQSQKMEAMGQLTGGVAHDFNNLLSPIIGGLDLLQRRGVGDERTQRTISGALASAERAKTLVQRLLAFARRQPLQPTTIDIGALIRGMADLIDSTSGPQVKVVVSIAEELPNAVGDQNQLEMALLNLSVNARDAMPDGGSITIGAMPEQIRKGHRSKLRPGHYVCISVSDTGEGMDEATLKRAIEPVFSTQGIGKGTGLGLSMVHGLAAQLGGEMAIASKIGLGTKVQLWLPVAEGAAARDTAAVEATSANPTGTALVVDDEDLVRSSTAEMLIDVGYSVVEAESAEQALRLVNSGLRPDVLVTDHLMPGMSGVELAGALKDRLPNLPVLIVSGYAETEGIAPDLPRLEKPFRRSDLVNALSEIATKRGGSTKRTMA